MSNLLGEYTKSEMQEGGETLKTEDFVFNCPAPVPEQKKEVASNSQPLDLFGSGG